MLQELARPSPSSQRLGEYRRAWLLLRTLAESVLTMPVTALAMLLYMLLMSTLAAYQCLVAFLEGQSGLAMMLILLGSHYYLLLLLICDSVHRAVEAVGTSMVLASTFLASVSY